MIILAISQVTTLLLVDSCFLLFELKKKDVLLYFVINLSQPYTYNQKNKLNNIQTGHFLFKFDELWISSMS